MLSKSQLSINTHHLINCHPIKITKCYISWRFPSAIIVDKIQCIQMAGSSVNYCNWIPEATTALASNELVPCRQSTWDATALFIAMVIMAGATFKFKFKHTTVSSHLKHRYAVEYYVTYVHMGMGTVSHIDGLLQERLNSIANALELHLSCTNPSIQWCMKCM